MYRRDSSMAQRIRQKDVFEKQKALILVGERLVLTTIRFDFNIQHPYKSLLDAMKNLGIIQKEVKQVAWNFVNDWLKTTVCLQYKPQYIAAGSLYLAAKLHNFKLPLHGAQIWWHQFDVAPKPLEAVIQQMMEHVALKKMMSARLSMVKQKEAISEAKLLTSNSPDSVLNQSSLSITSSSPDIGEPNDHMQVDSGGCLISSHIGDRNILGHDDSLLNVSANLDASSQAHEARLDQALMDNCHDGTMSCNLQTSLDAVAAIDGSAEFMKQDLSLCKEFNNTVSGENMNQASRNPHGDGANPLSNALPLGVDVDRKGALHVEPSAPNSYCTDSLSVGNLCSGQSLVDPAAGSINDAPSALSIEMGVDHLSAELKKVDVPRIKDLLMKRKRRRDIQEQAIASNDLSEEAWIERELESGIVTKQQGDHTATTSDELSEEAWIERELETVIVVGPRNEQVITLDGLSEDDWIERELESGIIVEPPSASKKQKIESCLS